jgi:hypothetical protein
VLARLPHARAAYLTGRSFFPSLISAPFAAGLHEAFDFAIAAMLIAAAASWLRGKPTGRPKALPALARSSAGAPADVPFPAGAVAEPPPGPDGSGPGVAAGRYTERNGQGRGNGRRPARHQAGPSSDLTPVSRARDSGPAGSGQDPGSAGNGAGQEIGR